MAARKWRCLNLKNDLYHDVLLSTFVIPTLSASQFKNCIDEILAIMEDNRKNYRDSMDDLLLFMEFLKKMWLPVPKIISFPEDITLSVDISEYLQRHLGSELGNLKLNIFQFSGTLKE